MGIKAAIKRDLGSFQLDLAFESQSSRIGILGASGCGKTMTLKSIAGVGRTDEAYIEVNGKVLVDTRQHICLKPQQRKIGYVFQNYALFPTQSVRRNIMAGLTGTKDEKRSRVDEMIRRFQLDGLEERLPGELSGGQQQRVALARIMAYEPEIILLDEPFSALDGYLREQLQQEMLEQLADYPGIVILVSHDRDEIYRFSQELLVMDRGRLICSGETRALFDNPGRETAARLTGCKNIVPVERIDDHTVEIVAWQMTVHSPEVIPDEINSIGYRAHDFIPVWGERKENCLAVDVKSSAQLPFEQKYFLNSSGGQISWFVQRELGEEIAERGIPDYLQLNTDKILYLQKD